MTLNNLNFGHEPSSSTDPSILPDKYWSIGQTGGAFLCTKIDLESNFINSVNISESDFQASPYKRNYANIIDNRGYVTPNYLLHSNSRNTVSFLDSFEKEINSCIEEAQNVIQAWEKFFEKGLLELFNSKYQFISDTNEYRLPEWLTFSLDKIAEIEKLPGNWDSYNSPSPSGAICALTRELLFNLRDLDLPEPVVAPIANGGIYLKLKKYHRELLIEFDDLSLIYATCLRIEKISRGEETREWKMNIANEFNQAVRWLIDSRQTLQTLAA